VRHDRGIEIMMGERGLHREFEALPATAEALLEEAVASSASRPRPSTITSTRCCST
jgi:hypothetical protein